MKTSTGIALAGAAILAWVLLSKPSSAEEPPSSSSSLTPSSPLTVMTTAPDGSTAAQRLTSNRSAVDYITHALQSGTTIQALPRAGRVGSVITTAAGNRQGIELLPTLTGGSNAVRITVTKSKTNSSSRVTKSGAVTHAPVLNAAAISKYRG